MGEVEPCWCLAMVGFVTHPIGALCGTREHWLDIEDSEFPETEEA